MDIQVSNCNGHIKSKQSIISIIYIYSFFYSRIFLYKKQTEHYQYHLYTVETPYSTIPYTTIFYITRWTHGPQNLQRPIRTLIVLLGFWIKQIVAQFVCLLSVPSTVNSWMNPHVARCRGQQWRQDRLPQTFTPYDPSRWSQWSSQVHSQRINGLPASYSADLNAWSNNFNTIFWSDVLASDASGSWFPVVLNKR